MKNKNLHIILAILLLLGIFPGFEACKRADSSVGPEKIHTKASLYDKIQERGTLVVAADFNSTSYFIYRGQPMGFQYQMLQELTNDLGLDLEVRIARDIDDSFNDLNSEAIDLVAMNLTVTSERKKKIAFTHPHSQTRQVLVQRSLNPDGTKNTILANQLDLAGKKVFVQKGSVYYNRLLALSNEIGEEIEIHPVAIEAEQLVHMVAKGEIDYTIADENVAKINQVYFGNLDVAVPVSFQQNIAWALSKDSDELKEVIDLWLKDFKQTTRYAVIYNKYFKHQYVVPRVSSDYYVMGEGNISRYDHIVQREAERIAWDWRLVSSMMYQESRFNPQAESWAGAFGLMQMMPTTAKKYGVTKESSPEKQIVAGVKLIKFLDKRFEEDVEDPLERKKFVLAAYNVGRGHVNDAMRLASKYGDQSNVWDGNVEKWLLSKSQPIYYKDPVVKYGYARGIETSNYVKEVNERFEHYKNIVNLDLLASNPKLP